VSFDIVTTVSEDFVSGLDLFVPSWARYSGADSIRIHLARTSNWYEGIIERNVNLYKELLEASITGRRVLSLDLDVFVLENLEGGFDGDHPIAVARWPEPNMGVAFFDTSIEFDWSRFFDPLIEKITERCRNPKVWGTNGRKGRLGDSPCWFEALRSVAPMIRKLDPNVWNFCSAPQDTERLLTKHREKVKVLHLKGRGNWTTEERFRRRLQTFRKFFSEKIGGAR